HVKLIVSIHYAQIFSFFTLQNCLYNRRTGIDFSILYDVPVWVFHRRTVSFAAVPAGSHTISAAGGFSCVCFSGEPSPNKNRIFTERLACPLRCTAASPVLPVDFPAGKIYSIKLFFQALCVHIAHRMRCHPNNKRGMLSWLSH
ncbi:hypothetical protein, partial [Butyricicoccus sp.]|uniref:hypothetical protein n=1 Tax=Butyricicoccus sp. TaxID=2049021 RepID=UPI003F18F282